MVKSDAEKLIADLRRYGKESEYFWVRVDSTMYDDGDIFVEVGMHGLIFSTHHAVYNISNWNDYSEDMAVDILSEAKIYFADRLFNLD